MVVVIVRWYTHTSAKTSLLLIYIQQIFFLVETGSIADFSVETLFCGFFVLLTKSGNLNTIG